MKMIMYSAKDEDGIFGMLAYTSHKHFIAEQIRDFMKKVGQYKPVTWHLLGEYDTLNGKITPYEPIIEFDWEKQLADDMQKDVGNAIETSSIAKAIEQDIGDENA